MLEADGVEAHFGQHPDAEIYLSQPGLGTILGARVLGEFGDDPDRYAGARARKNYAGTSPITRQSGKKKTVHARHVHNDRLLDALGRQAQSALNVSPGARAYYDQLRDRGVGHSAALRQLANRLVGILHGCLKTRTLYDEATAWPPRRRRSTGCGLTTKALGCLCRPLRQDQRAGHRLPPIARRPMVLARRSSSLCTCRRLAPPSCARPRAVRARQVRLAPGAK